MKDTPQTIRLVHGLWVTPLSWAKFRHYFEGLGHTVVAPAWPGITKNVPGLRRDASSLHGIGIHEVVAHYTEIIRRLTSATTRAPRCWSSAE